MADFSSRTNQRCSYKRLFGVTFGLSLGLWITLTSTPGLTEPFHLPHRGLPGRREGGGTRGGCGGSLTGLTLLAPYREVGKTTSSHPTFTWFVPENQAYPLEFRLYQQGSDQKRQLLQAAHLQATAGMMQYTLPSTQPGLTVGQRYTWQVITLCDPNHPSAASIITAEIEIVAPSSSLQSQLTTTKRELDRAKVYAHNNVWYDAIAAAFKLPQDQAAKQVQLSLLEALAKSETTENRTSLNEQVTQLQRVGAIEQQQ